MLWDKKACLKAAFVTIILFSLIDVAAMAMPSDSTPFIRVINGSSDPDNPAGYTMLEPGNSLTDGNWIILDGGNAIRVPDMSVRYNGPDVINGSPGTAIFNWPVFSSFGIGNDYSVEISPHDLTVPFSTYPVYTESGNNVVGATFYGSSDYANKDLHVKLLDLTSVSDKITFTDISTIKNTMKQLTIADIKNSEVKDVLFTADANGDILSIQSKFSELNGMTQGYYALVVMDDSNQNMPCIVAEAPIIVTKNAMDVSTIDSAPKPGDSITFIEDQQGAAAGRYTYVVAMIPEANYTADINITSDGSVSGTFVTFHGLSLNETFNVVSDGTEDGTTVYFDGLAADHIALSKSDLDNADYMQKLVKDELAKSNIAIGTITTPDTTDVSIQVPTTDTMPTGKYIVLAAAVDRDTGRIAAINQTTIDLGGSWTCHLKQGWNLISIPIVPDHTSVTTFFPPEVMSHIIVVWDYDNSNQANPWSYYTTWTEDYEQGTLTTITEQRGYWVLCDSDVDFTVTGSIPDNTNIPIGANWNLVGHPTTETPALTEVYPDACVFWEYDSSNPTNPWSYYTTWTEDYEQGTLTTMRPGYGYWVLKL